MIGQQELMSMALMSLGEDVFSETQQWYEETRRSKARYIVYVVRRCYMLALIMEHITGKKMVDSEEREFLTDASFFLRCNELAEYYRKYNQFPKILLCDDILIHGRNINHFLKSLEDQLCELLSEYEEGEIQVALVAAIKIHVYVRAEEPLLLLGRYELSLNYIRKETPAFWRRVSSNISTLILRADMANACYVFSESMPEDVLCRIKENARWKKTVFQNTVEYAFVSYAEDDDLLKAIYTIRVVKAQRAENYRVIPFVFLPNLSETETSNIKDAIFNKLRKAPEWLKIEGYIDNLYKVEGKRVFNEWLTLLMSQAFLSAFNQEFNIRINSLGQEYINEREKLLRNYNVYGKAISMDILDFALTQNVLSIADINEILMENINEHYIMELDIFKEECEQIDKESIREDLEDYFYDNAIMEEISAFELTQISYVPTKRRSMRRVRGCGFTLDTLNDCYTKSEMDYSMAYFLQMMDAGVLAISSYASRETKVVGFAQFAKAGEQSLQIYPLRFYEYMPLLIKIYRRCVLNRLDFIEEIVRFFSSKYCKVEFQRRDEILDFVKRMLSVGQTPLDWSGNYLVKIDLGDEQDERTRVKSLLWFRGKQGLHVDSYEEYMEG